MHGRISVAFRGRCHHELRAAAQRRFESFEGPVRSDAQGLDSVFGVVYRARWTGKMKYIIKRAPLTGMADIFLDELKARIVPQVLDVGEAAGQQIVRGHNRIALAQQPVAQVRSQKARPTRYQRSFYVFGSRVPGSR